MTLLPARKSLTPTGDPNTYYNKGETDALLSGKASTDLTNLSSTGQMVIDSQNGTISNCVLEIPQNIKCELSGTTYTLKAGSVRVKLGETYTTQTVVNDMPLTIDVSTDGRFVIIGSSNNEAQINIEKISSGTTTPLTKTTDYFWNITDKLMYRWVSADSMYKPFSTWCYPSCLIDVVSGVASFAKDSNGNDMIFNGACFVGHHAVVYPNVKALIPDGFNDDGSMKSISVTRSALTIREIVGNQYFSIGSATAINPRPAYFEVNTLDDLYAKNLQGFYYVKSLNQCYSWGGGSSILYAGNCVFIHVNISRGIVTDFTIRQPVRTATVEMVNKKQDVLTFDITPTASSTNPVTSGGVYTALGTKQADLLTVSGYDATATQVLKNINGVLTWVTEE